MAVEEKNPLKEFRKEAYEFHKPVLQRLNVPVTNFIAKPGFFEAGGGQLIGLYPNEIKEGEDLYIELCDKEKKPFPGRKLYRWIYNPFISQEYELSPLGSYTIPVDELQVINPIAASELGETYLAGKSSAEKPLLSTKSVSPSGTVHPTTQSTAPVAMAAALAAPAPNLSGSIMDRPVSQLTTRELMAIVYKDPNSGNSELDQRIMYNNSKK